MQSIELQEKIFIDAHEVSQPNWGTPNVVLHRVLTTLLMLLASTAERGSRGRVRCSGRCSPVAGRDPASSCWGAGMPGGLGVRWPGMLRSLPAAG